MSNDWQIIKTNGLKLLPTSKDTRENDNKPNHNF